MKRASEYRAHADECRALAMTMPAEQREQLMAIAETWESLAADRARMIARHPERAHAGERREEREHRESER